VWRERRWEWPRCPLKKRCNATDSTWVLCANSTSFLNWVRVLTRMTTTWEAKQRCEEAWECREACKSSQLFCPFVGCILCWTLLCFVGAKVWHAPCCVSTCCFPSSFLSGSSCDTVALRATPVIFWSLLNFAATLALTRRLYLVLDGISEQCMHFFFHKDTKGHTAPFRNWCVMLFANRVKTCKSCQKSTPRTWG